ncbi:PC-esterase domain-containing protein 1B-like [Saccopteryx bilineata]|uniref:PC-esterase domain-containing protein 1B-like n=1 Tax=Saccopteryx bilineata TaxID=59482 RepID=UPI00338FBC9A
MAHLRACEVRQLLHNKFVVIMGDSVQRAVYKDLVILLQRDCLLSPSQLRTKGELTFEGDVLLEGGRWGRMHNGTHYREVRQYRAAHHLLRFYFLTRAFSPYVVDVLDELRGGLHAPDVVVVNSCLWDLSRYGRDFRSAYRQDLESLFGLLRRALPARSLLLWNTAMPVAEVVSGGFLLPEQQAQGAHLRRDVVEANFYSAVEASRHGLDVLDLHFHFRRAGQHRLRDGVHWDQRAHRHLSQLLLAHVADAWGVDLPCRAPVGRWIRDGSASASADPEGGRQPSDSRGDTSRQAWSQPPPRLMSVLTPRQPSTPIAHARHPFSPYDQSTRVSSHPSSHSRQLNRDLPTLQVERTREGSSRISVLERLGPVHRVSSRHQSRGYPPYPLQHPSRPHRRQRRDT